MSDTIIEEYKFIYRKREGTGMSDFISMNYRTIAYNRMLSNRAAKNTKTQGMGKDFRTSVEEAAARKEAGVTENKNTSNRDSVVDAYKRKHPNEAHHVDAQVRMGRAVRAKKGVAEVSAKDMTMDEYKSFITSLLYSIPFDATRIYDEEVVSISDEGWEQMKNDPDYEAWVLGYTAENRSVRNPFFGLPGTSGNFYVEKFGATIEEHLGQSVGPTGPVVPSPTNGKRKKSWWQKRQERMEEAMQLQVNKALRRKQAQRILEQKRYQHGRISASAIDAYANSLMSFNSIIKPSKG